MLAKISREPNNANSVALTSEFLQRGRTLGLRAIVNQNYFLNYEPVAVSGGFRTEKLDDFVQERGQFSGHAEDRDNHRNAMEKAVL